MVVVAALLVTSVSMVTITQAIVITAKTGKSPKGVRSSATHRDKPDSWTQNRTHSYTLRFTSTLCLQAGMVWVSLRVFLGENVRLT